jgi:hypothetical protein
MRTLPAQDASDIIPPDYHQLVTPSWIKRQPSLMHLPSIFGRPANCNIYLMADDKEGLLL